MYESSPDCKQFKEVSVITRVKTKDYVTQELRQLFCLSLQDCTTYKLHLPTRLPAVPQFMEDGLSLCSLTSSFLQISCFFKSFLYIAPGSRLSHPLEVLKQLHYLQ